MLPRNFSVTVEVSELFELSYAKEVQEYDQREGPYSTTQHKTKTFLSEKEARDFIRKEQVRATELVRVTKIPL